MELPYLRLLGCLIVCVTIAIGFACSGETKRGIHVMSNARSTTSEKILLQPTQKVGYGTDIRTDAATNSSFADNRESRKLFMLTKSFLSKPKVSKLYLVNGTLCRFVNLTPVCTTLSTTPLLRKH